MSSPNTSGYFCQMPGIDVSQAPPWGSIIAVYTRAGKGLYGAARSKGLLQRAIPVFSPLREFYAPVYENLSPEDWTKPDLRAVVHWEPEMETGQNKKSFTSFYNADNMGEMLVVVEAIADDGRIGYQEMSYSVDKR